MNITPLRISICVALLVTWAIAWNLFTGASTITRQSLAVATVNGGTSSYVAQQVVEHGSLWHITNIVVSTAIVFVCFYKRQSAKS